MQLSRTQAHISRKLWVHVHLVYIYTPSIHDSPLKISESFYHGVQGAVIYPKNSILNVKRPPPQHSKKNQAGLGCLVSGRGWGVMPYRRVRRAASDLGTRPGLVANSPCLSTPLFACLSQTPISLNYFHHCHHSRLLLPLRVFHGFQIEALNASVSV